MIFLRSRRSIYLRVPKTASTSLSMQILDKVELQPGDFSTGFGSPTHGWIPDKGFNNLISRLPTIPLQTDEHMLLHKLWRFGILKEEELESYAIYGFLRNPLERFFSVFAHMFHLGHLDITKMTKEEIASRGIDILKNAKIPYEFVIRQDHNDKISNFPLLPQSRWLTHNNKPINNIVLFPNFDEFLTKWTGSSKLEYREKIGDKPIHSEVGSDLIDQIHHWYADDFELWERLSRGRSPAQ